MFHMRLTHVVVLSAVLTFVATAPALRGQPSLKNGWPQQTGGVVQSSPVVADLDSDDQLEIIVGSNDWKLYAWNHDGSSVSGWPVTLAGCPESSPAVGDLDRDGHLEIVVGTTNQWLYVLNPDGTILPGWPIELQYMSSVRATPALGDIDQDGEDEIVVAGLYGVVWVWNLDATLVPGWPVGFAGNVWSSPAVGDLDGDGDLEIAVAFGYDVYVLEPGGSPLTGWPMEALDVVYSSPAIGDIDSDGQMELVVGTDADRVHVLNSDCTEAPGWPVIGMGDEVSSSAALGDIDGDGDLEIAVMTESHEVYALDGDGTVLPGWPVHAGSVPAPHPVVFASPVIGDIDGDDGLEVVITASHSTSDSVYAWNSDGTVASGWPVGMGSGSPGPSLTSSPLITDLEGDSIKEVVACSQDSSVYVWELEGGTQDPQGKSWPMFRKDMGRTGALLDPGAGLGNDTIEPVPISLKQNRPNPFSASTVLSYAISRQSRVRLIVYSVRGQSVKTLVDCVQAPGQYNLEWRADNDFGAQVGSGIYSVVLRSGDQCETKRLVVLH